tara:strand:+ start:262 stop:552 length:291 start_codon:yes stop_codon:yes gene_type:complete
MNKEEEALSAEYFKDAAELLEKTYRRFYSGKREAMFVEDLDVLWDNVQPMDGYVFCCQSRSTSMTLPSKTMARTQGIGSLPLPTSPDGLPRSKRKG